GLIPNAIQVGLDIKPGSLPNSVNSTSAGTIPVAILSTSRFNAVTSVDFSTLTFGRTGNEKSLKFCNGNGEDVNGDRLLDLVCHFNTGKAGFQFGDTQGVLKGRTFSGISFVGSDSVGIVP